MTDLAGIRRRVDGATDDRLPEEAEAFDRLTLEEPPEEASEFDGIVGSSQAAPSSKAVD